MAPIVEKLSVEHLQLGEGPHWDIPSQSLYMVDILGDQILRYHPETRQFFKAKLGIPLPGFIVPVEGIKNKFVVASGTKLYLFTWNGESETVENLEVLVETHEPANHRINDGKCDPSGRVWFGAMNIKEFMTDKTAGFYSYSKNGGLTQHFTGVGCSNGLTWDKNKNAFYYIDSVRLSVDGFYYTHDGKISNRRTVFNCKTHFPDNCPLPDGMTIDTDGNLWVALFGGSKVIKIDPTSGNLLQQVVIPAPKVTSVAFGGPKLDELYVTTASYVDSENEEVPPMAGATFRITGIGATGLPMQNIVL